MGIELGVCCMVDRRVSRSHDGVELSLLVGCRPYLTSLPREAFARFDFARMPPRHQIGNEALRGRRKMFHRMHFYGMAWGSPPELDARRFDCATAVEAGSLFQEAVARLAVE